MIYFQKKIAAIPVKWIEVSSMGRMSVSSMMSYGADAIAATYKNSKTFSRRSMKKMKRKVKSLF